MKSKWHIRRQIDINNVAEHLVADHGFFAHEVSVESGRPPLTLLRDHDRLHAADHEH